MKRALAITMTIALLGSLLFVGFAGTAAAGSYDDKHDDYDDHKHGDDKKDDRKHGDDKKDDRKHGDDKKDDRDHKHGDDKKDDRKHGDDKKDDRKHGDDKKDDRDRDHKHGDDKKDDRDRDHKHGDDKKDDRDRDHKHGDDGDSYADDVVAIGQISDAETNQYQNVDQENNLKQGDNVAASYKGDAAAANFAEQNNTNAQAGASISGNFAFAAQK
ncbi:toxin transporter [Natronococcus sp. JC468]|uniref:toxin transporter n=1 Tax=Natronococcus sp. JC468 TaxID=1961921 RepID=UPI00143A0F82|nr:toxin transporter [Natronococcus sp. JC468]NKE35518.1 toxin transporter [Natronococcus sp. JC468]